MPELKSFPFPVWSADSADYTAGEYEPEIEPRLQGSNSVTIRHVFHGGGLIRELLKGEQAVFGCVVVLRSTMYRRVFIASPVVAHEQRIECEQTIDYGDSGYGQVTAAVESPVFRPIILAQKGVKKAVNAAADGVIPLWDGVEIQIRPGGIVAYGGWERFGGTCGGMFVVELDDELDDWQMHVSEHMVGGFRFVLNAGKGLYHSIQYPTVSTASQRRSVLTHAVSAALSLLKEKSKEDAGLYDEHINLRLFANWLKSEDLGDWRDKNFQPDRAATALYPHVFPRKDEDDD